MNSEEKLQQAREVIQEWIDKQGHERCWYYPDLFNKLAKTLGINPRETPNLPSLEEFKCGCERYQEEEFGKRIRDRITKEKLEKYRSLTEQALKIARKSIVKGKDQEAKEIFTMVENYLSDSEYFENQNDFVDAFAALSYAHGWLDSGARLDVFNVKDDRLFTIK